MSWSGITFLAITDPSIEQARLFRGLDRFDPATTAVQWRDKRGSDEGPDWALARTLAVACRSKGLMFFVNVRPELLAGADELLAELAPAGVHVGEGASPEEVAAARRWGLVTRPAHDAAGVRRALAEGARPFATASEFAGSGVARDGGPPSTGADGVLVSPIFAVPGKGAPRGLDALREARLLCGGRAKPRIFALGGVTEATRALCMEAGADGIAAIRSAWL